MRVMDGSDSGKTARKQMFRSKEWLSENLYALCDVREPRVAR